MTHETTDDITRNVPQTAPMPILPSECPGDLALLPPNYRIGVKELAGSLKRNVRTIQRWIRQSFLPPPFRCGAGKYWFVHRILEHWEKLSDAALNKKQRQEQRLSNYEYGGASHV